MSGLDALRADPEHAALRALSARLGADRLQIQAAGGNTSLKRDGAMLVKASGSWLRDAEARDIMVPVRQGDLLARFDALKEADIAGFVPPEENPHGLRPSIETAVHAVLPWPVVLHTHAVGVIAAAIQADAPRLVRERVGDLGGVFIPYVKPGLPLARSIRERAGGSPLLILGHHGLVACGGTVAQAEALLREATARFETGPIARADASPGPGLKAALTGTGYRPAERAHALALDEGLRRRAATGSYYPDHVVFLGRAAAVAERVEEAGGAALVLLPGRGAALRADLGPAADAMALCLLDVLARVPERAPLRPLPPEAEAELLDWDAEAYRQALGQTLGPPGALR